MMRKRVQKYDPLMLQLNLFRALGLIFLWVHWVLTSGEGIGILLLLGLLIFLFLRQYLPSNLWVLLGGAIFAGALGFVWPPAILAFCVPVFEGSLINKPLWIVPGLILVSLGAGEDLSMIFIFIFAGFLGYLHRIALQQRNYYKNQS